FDPGGKKAEIPQTSYVAAGSGQRSVRLDVRQPMEGSYLLEVTGTAPESYTLALRAWDRSGTVTVTPELRDLPTEPGVVHLYRLDYASTGRAPLKLAGRFEGDRLLGNSNKPGTEPRLRG